MRSPMVLIGKMIAAGAAVGAFAVAVTIIAERPAPASAAGRSLALTRGEETFRRYCARCHSLDEGAGGGQGPNLHDIGLVAAKRKPGVDAPSYILESIVEPDAFHAPGYQGGMPLGLVRSLTDEQILDLVRYLAHRGAEPDPAQFAALKVPDLEEIRLAPLSDLSRPLVLRGEHLFRNEAGCANATRSTGSPSGRCSHRQLFGVGHVDDALIRQSILEPGARVAPGYRQVAVALADGRVLTGLRLSQDEDRLSLLSVDDRGQATRQDIPISEVDRDDDGSPLIRDSEVSPMPSNYGELLEAEDLNALVAYIRAMN